MNRKIFHPCQLVSWTFSHRVGRTVAGFLHLGLCLLKQQWAAFPLIIMGSQCILGSCFSWYFCKGGHCPALPFYNRKLNKEVMFPSYPEDKTKWRTYSWPFPLDFACPFTKLEENHLLLLQILHCVLFNGSWVLSSKDENLCLH